jgi:transcriptional regulatory protein LevR
VPRGSFEGRLDLLAASQQLTPEARAATVSFIGEFERHFGIELGEDNGALMVTHLAMAVTRLTRGAPEREAPSSLVREVGERPDEVAWVRGQMETMGRTLGITVPESEVTYMAAHVQTIGMAHERRDG